MGPSSVSRVHGATLRLSGATTLDRTGRPRDREVGAGSLCVHRVVRIWLCLVLAPSRWRSLRSSQCCREALAWHKVGQVCWKQGKQKKGVNWDTADISEIFMESSCDGLDLLGNQLILIHQCVGIRGWNSRQHVVDNGKDFYGWCMSAV